MSTKNMHAFTATIQKVDGRLRAPLDYPQDWQTYLNANYQPGDRIWIYSKRYRKQRSTGADPKRGNQNGYYWAVVVADIAAHTGHTPQEIHTELKAMFNPVPSLLSPEITKPGSTQNLDTLEFEEYLERIRVWAADPHDGLGLTIPLPNETPDGEE